jgi:hypothetical protein
MNTRKLAKLGALKNQLIFSAHVGRKKRGIEDTTVDGMKINRDDFSKGLLLSANAAIAHRRSSQSPTLTASDPFSSSHEIRARNQYT